MVDKPRTTRRDYKAALAAIVEWQESCLNAYHPDKTARRTPDDNDLCELFNRLDRARKLLRPAKAEGPR